VGAILRVAVFVASHDWIVFRIPVLDAGFYHETARGLLAGTWPGREPFFMGPFFSYLLAVVYALPGPDLFSIRLAQLLLGLATIAGSALIARRLFGDVAGSIAAWLLAFYGPLVFYEQMPLLETSFVCFCVFLFERTLAWRNGAGLRGALPAGLLLGALVALRGTSILYIAPVAALAWPRLRSKATMAFLAAIVLVVAPFALHNRSAGSRALTTTSLGFNLYVGNHEGATGLFQYPNGWRAETDPSGRVFASGLAGRKLTPDEADAFWRAQTWSFMKENPGATLILALRKVALFAQGEEIPQEESYRFFLRNVPIARAALAGWWLVLPLALAAAIFLRVRPPAFYGLVGFVLVPALVCATFFVTARYRVAAAPFLVILGSAGLASWFVHAPRRRDWAGAAVALLGAVVLLVLPPPYDPVRAMAREYEHVGLRYQKEGSFWTAEEQYRRAVELNPRDGDAWNNLGTVLVRMEKLSQAEEAFQSAARCEPGNPVPLLNLGLLRGHERDHAGAERYFRRASEIDPDNVDVLINLGTALAVQERLPEAVTIFERAVHADPANGTAREMLLSARDLLETVNPESVVR